MQSKTQDGGAWENCGQLGAGKKRDACGEGKTKKSAEQVAAYQTILLLKNQ